MDTPFRPRTGLVLVVAVAVGCLAVGVAAAQQPPAQPMPMGVRSKVKVTVPQDDATLVVENVAVKTAGKVREFDTPDLEAGKRYIYDFVATWKPNKFTTITRKATRKFTAGEAVDVDLTKDEGNDVAVVTLARLPDDVVEAVVKAAKITKDDVAFELGGQDARTLAAAVKGGAKRGVWVQADEGKVKAAKELVKKEQLEGKIDIQQAEPTAGKDYAEATVVFLYVGEEVNTALRPVLLRDVKAGTRVVSYRFKMGDWPPAETVKGVNSDGDNYEIYVWTVSGADKAKYGKK